MKQILNFVNGEFTTSEQTYTNVSPTNGKAIGLVHEAGNDLVDRAVCAAQSALNGEWEA